MKTEILQIVRTLLNDVAEKPERLERAYELAEGQIIPIIEASKTHSGLNVCPSHYDGYSCTRPEGHSGEHIAEGTHKRVLMRWDQPKHLDRS